MEDEINIREYVDIVLKGWKIIAAATAIFAVGAYLITLTMKPVYESSSMILIRGGGSSSGLSALAAAAGFNVGGGDLGQFGELVKTKKVQKSVEQNIDTLSDLLQSRNLTKQAYEKVFGKRDMTAPGPLSTKEGLGKMEAKIVGSFLIITVENNNPYLAAAAANAYVDALADYWNKLNYTESRKKKEYLEMQIPISEASLRKVEDEIKDLTYLSGIGGDAGTKTSDQSIEMTRLKSEFEIQNSVYSMLRREYEITKLELAKEISPFSDIEKAVVPSAPIRPNKKNNIAVGAALGLFAGVFLAFAAKFFGNK